MSSIALWSEDISGTASRVSERRAKPPAPSVLRARTSQKLSVGPRPTRRDGRTDAPSSARRRSVSLRLCGSSAQRPPRRFGPRGRAAPPMLPRRRGAAHHPATGRIRDRVALPLRRRRRDGGPAFLFARVPLAARRRLCPPPPLGRTRAGSAPNPTALHEPWRKASTSIQRKAALRGHTRGARLRICRFGGPPKRPAARRQAGPHCLSLRAVAAAGVAAASASLRLAARSSPGWRGTPASARGRARAHAGEPSSPPRRGGGTTAPSPARRRSAPPAPGRWKAV